MLSSARVSELHIIETSSHGDFGVACPAAPAPPPLMQHCLTFIDGSDLAVKAIRGEMSEKRQRYKG